MWFLLIYRRRGCFLASMKSQQVKTHTGRCFQLCEKLGVKQ